MFTPCEYDDDFSLSKIKLVNEAPTDANHWCSTLYQDKNQFLYLKKQRDFLWTAWYVWINNSWVRINTKYTKSPYLKGYMQTIDGFVESIKSTREHYKFLKLGDERRGHGDWKIWRDLHRKSDFWKEAAI